MSQLEGGQRRIQPVASVFRQLCTYPHCGVVSCWLIYPPVLRVPRPSRHDLTAFVPFATCIWEGVASSWQHLFVACLILGFGIGPKSTIALVCAAECVLPVIRGAFIVMWCVIIFSPSKPHITSLTPLCLKQANVDGFWGYVALLVRYVLQLRT